MDLLIAILIFMGALLSPDCFTDEYRHAHSDEIDRANYIIDNSYYRTDDGGGIISIEVTD